MRGNSHVRFLGGRGSAMTFLLPYLTSGLRASVRGPFCFPEP